MTEFKTDHVAEFVGKSWTYLGTEEEIAEEMQRKRLPKRVCELAQARKKLEAAQDVVKFRQAHLEQTTEWQWLQDAKSQVAEVKGEVATLEQNVRDMGLVLFNVDGNKQPHPAVDIKEFKVVEYDETKAIDWAANAMQRYGVLPEDNQAVRSIRRV